MYEEVYTIVLDPGFIFTRTDRYSRAPDAEDKFLGAPGVEHYRLLALLSSRLENATIIDIGTHMGFSAQALTHGKTNTIHTFDVNKQFDDQLLSNKNVIYHQKNLWSPDVRAEYRSLLLSSKLIFLDVDPHNGTMEYDFYCFLRDNNYQGMLVCNGIWYFKPMRDNFWFKVPQKYKQDLTKWGHFSGTGLIEFKEKLIEKYHWTFVSGYFDLTVYDDASREIKDRPFDYYLQGMNTTMSVESNLVIYCDQKSYPYIEKLRPDYLKKYTKYVVMDFEEFPLNRYRQKIKENRERYPVADPMNTVSYYLFCMARYEMVKREIDANTFGSSHFAWVNIDIERCGYKNIIGIQDVINTNRDKFSTMYIDYIPQHLINDLPNYFKWGRCSLCSGFFTGNTQYMRRFCELIEQQFIRYVDAGYGHADEQLFSPIYFQNRDLFEVYYGDYQSMITNYTEIKEDVGSVIRFLIGNSFNNQDWEVCYGACKAVFKYHQQHPIDNQLAKDYLIPLIKTATYYNDTQLVEQALQKLKFVIVNS